MMFDPQDPAIPQPYRTVNPVHAFFIALLGPADSPAHPLIGTKYDPYYQQLRQSESLERRRARAEQRRQRGVAVTDQPFGASSPLADPQQSLIADSGWPRPDFA